MIKNTTILNVVASPKKKVYPWFSMEPERVRISSKNNKLTQSRRVVLTQSKNC